jgi:hypothetical protein
LDLALAAKAGSPPLVPIDKSGGELNWSTQHTQFLCWRLILQGLAGPFDELPCDCAAVLFF